MHYEKNIFVAPVHVYEVNSVKIPNYVNLILDGQWMDQLSMDPHSK